MNSNDLKQCKSTLEELAKREIDNPMTDYTKLNRLLKMIKEVDTLRREIWNNEKFGACEEMADNVMNFTADDIPF